MEQPLLEYKTCVELDKNN